MVNKGLKTFSKASIKTKRISIMNLNFCSVFFILLTSFCFTTALQCYKCEGVDTGLAVLCRIPPNPRIQSGSVIYSPDCYLLTRMLFTHQRAESSPSLMCFPSLNHQVEATSPQEAEL